VILILENKLKLTEVVSLKNSFVSKIHITLNVEHKYVANNPILCTLIPQLTAKSF
jgi:hypothetical protein